MFESLGPVQDPFAKLPKLSRGDKVAILSPSFAAPGRWPHVHELGLKRLSEVFGLAPVEFPTTRIIGASKEDRARDLIAAFEDPMIRAVITSIGGDGQVTYVKNLPREPFIRNPKPFFGYSDNSHFSNHLWLCGVPSFYGAAIFTEFAAPGALDPFSVKYIERALFSGGSIELTSSNIFSDIGLNWDEPENLKRTREFEPNIGWEWSGGVSTQGISWGGCLESIDEMLRHGVPIPSLKQFERIVLLLETSEEIPAHSYVARVIRALGERGILERVQGVLVGRPKAWEFDKPLAPQDRVDYRREQRTTILNGIRAYNESIPVVQNIDFGHTAPQICFPLGKPVTIDTAEEKLIVEF